MDTVKHMEDTATAICCNAIREYTRQIDKHNYFISGGTWGAFNTTGHHFFNPSNPTYQSIVRIAAIRKEEPALRYGRQTDAGGGQR